MRVALQPLRAGWGTARRLYGASPLHLLAHLAAFAASGYALVRILNREPNVNFLIWFLAGALLHDVVFLPLYSVLDAVARLGIHAPRARWHPNPPAINHLRVPTLISALLLLVYFPLILGEGLVPRHYLHDTGHQPHGYLRNWLLISAALFAGSALIYALRLRGRSIRAARPSDP